MSSPKLVSVPRRQVMDAAQAALQNELITRARLERFLSMPFLERLKWLFTGKVD